ncbi:MAG: hypothetical protein WCY05_01600 [Candidatus Omnitrophota bacterium]
MKKRHLVIFGVFLFLASLLFLHQKILIYVEAYRLSKNHRLYNELVDKRDYLKYNLTKETSVTKINQWAEKNKFLPAEKVLALNLRKETPVKSVSKISLALNQLMGISSGSVTALAGEKEE